ncbi:MAG TPA: methyltransferase domain-containing protein [Thermoanaerobaculia bacterium]|nr:methyltransferase domain-containing protein [Thermoanaerobaculia bacterium]
MIELAEERAAPPLSEVAVERVSRPRGWVRRLQERMSPRRVKTSAALRFYHEVLGLDHLHYGLWNGEPLSLAGLKGAQDRFARHLCDWVPSETRTILDVGCGTGSTAVLLAARGFEVEGLSPDPSHERLFTRRVGTPFHLVRFQEFRPPRAYDLVLMSESAQYIWLDRFFPAVLEAAPGGRLLVADYFTVRECAGPIARSGHRLEPFLDEAERSGLVLERREDVTDRVLPTLNLARSWLESYVEPCLRIAGEAVSAKRPRLAAVGRRLLRGRLAQLEELRQLVDGAAFRAHKRYLMLLFRVPE